MADMTTLEGLAAGINECRLVHQKMLGGTPDGTWCPDCSGVRRMSVQALHWQTSLGDVQIRMSSRTVRFDPDDLPSVFLLKCVQCRMAIIVVAYVGPTGPTTVALPESLGGLGTPATPEPVGYYLDQAARAQSIGALSAAVTMYRAALEQLLFEQGFTSGMLHAKITALEDSQSPPAWRDALAPEFMRAVKDLGNAAIHPNGGDIGRQAAFDAALLRQVHALFAELLDRVYEQPGRQAQRLDAIRRAAGGS